MLSENQTADIIKDESHSLQLPPNGIFNNLLGGNYLDMVMAIEILISFCFEVVLITSILLKYKITTVVTSGCFFNLPILRILFSAAVLTLTALSVKGSVDDSLVITIVVLMELIFASISSTSNLDWRRVTMKEFVTIFFVFTFIFSLYVTLSLMIGITNFYSIQYFLLASTLFAICTSPTAFTTRRRNNVTRRELSKKKSNSQTVSSIPSVYTCFSVILSLNILWLPLFIRNITMIVDLYQGGRNTSYRNAAVLIALFNSLLDLLLFVRSIKDSELKET